MRPTLVILAAGAALLFGAGVGTLPAAAMPAGVATSAVADAADLNPTIIPVAEGCGPGFHRNFRGFCRPNGGFYGRPGGFYGRRCFFRPGPFGGRRICRF